MCTGKVAPHYYSSKKCQHHTPTRMARLVAEDTKQLILLYIANENENCFSHIGKLVGTVRAKHSPVLPGHTT